MTECGEVSRVEQRGRKSKHNANWIELSGGCTDHDRHPGEREDEREDTHRCQWFRPADCSDGCNPGRIRIEQKGQWSYCYVLECMQAQISDERLAAPAHQHYLNDSTLGNRAYQRDSHHDAQNYRC